MTGILRAAPSAPLALRRLVAAACACLTLSAHAAETPDPAAPPDSAPPFERYQSWREAPPGDWRKLNERVGEIGGWRTYLRESQDEGGHEHHGHHDHH